MMLAAAPQSPVAMPDLNRRLTEYEESLTEKLNALQSKVSSVLQLLVARVKALEAKTAQLQGDQGSSPPSANLAGGLETVPE